jgi:basic amino acid/polyamine antiporter, APA family
VTEPATQPPSQSISKDDAVAARTAFVKRLFQRKTPSELIEDAYKPAHGMRKTLTVFDLIAFGIGATIGSGIFALTGTAAAGQSAASTDLLSTPIINFLLHSPLGREGAGPALVVSFLIAALACGLTALCYAELSAMIPVSGSAYTFAYAGLGEIIAWIIGWDLILEYAVGNIAVAISWSDYFLQFFHGVTGWGLPLWLTTDTGTALTKIANLAPGDPIRHLYSSMDLPSVMGHPLALNVPALAIVALITGLLVIGIQESARVNVVIVFVKLIIVLFFVGYGSQYVNPHNWVPFSPNGLAGIMGGAAIVFFAFIGFDAVSSTAEEVKNPQKDMPKGMIGSLIICTVLYVAVSLVLTGILPYKSYADDAAPVATALAHTGNQLAQIIVSAGALAGMTSVLLVFQLGQPRIFMAMARDRLLPKFFGTLHPTFRTPYIPTILTGVFVGFTALFINIGEAADLCNIGTLWAFILVSAGVIGLRITHATQPRPFRCPLSPWLPVASIVACLTLMLSLPVMTWLRFFLWLAVGMVIYFGYGYKRTASPGTPKLSAINDQN